jgi:hypothetical protein
MNVRARLARIRRAPIAALVAAGALVWPLAGSQLPALAAGTDPVTISSGNPPVTWTSDAFLGGTYVTTDNAAQCFDSSGQPKPPVFFGPAACEVFTLHVVGSGSVKFHSEEGANDFDFYVFANNGGVKGPLVTAAGASGGTGGVEDFTISQAAGDYFIAVVAFATLTSTTGTFTFFTPTVIPGTPPTVSGGFPSFRASHDIFTSHSEPHMAMNPLNHANLVAGSKQYVNNAHYLFRIGMYSSFDGGQTWRDSGHLPVPDCKNSAPPCSSPATITPTSCSGDGPFSDACKFTTSDIWLSFDDEGNVYAIVLVSPSSNAGTGWEMWMYKSTDGGRTWPLANRRVIHDHIQRNLSKAFLDDKDAIAVDNYTQAAAPFGANKPRDGKVGTIYSCWGLDGTVAPTQTQVVSWSADGGNTWGLSGIPFPVSQQNVREIGCQIAIAPSGRVYVSFFVYGLAPSVAQYVTWSDDHGLTFPALLKAADVNPVPNHLQDADNFRNLSLPALAVSPTDSSVYVTWADERLTPNPDADIMLVKGSVTVVNGKEVGAPLFGNPIRVNQDGAGKDQFQPQIAVTASGQIDISYFDRRQDPSNFFIDTYLSRSDTGGATWTDTRVTSKMSDPRINPPIDGAGNFFYGDYQGLAADDNCAMPFWNGTHLANLSPTDPNYSKWQEVFSARIPNGTRSCPTGGGSCHEADGDGEVQRMDAQGVHRAKFHFDKDKCEDGAAESVDVQDADAHTDFHSTQMSTVAFDDVLHTITVTGSGTNSGHAVNFTMVAGDGIAGLGTFSLVLSDGYSVTGTLLSGLIEL